MYKLELMNNNSNGWFINEYKSDKFAGTIYGNLEYDEGLTIIDILAAGLDPDWDTVETELNRRIFSRQPA
jgi:hypothetical protein